MRSSLASQIESSHGLSAAAVSSAGISASGSMSGFSIESCLDDNDSSDLSAAAGICAECETSDVTSTAFAISSSSSNISSRISSSR
ncbi:hypothetical protein GGF37_006249, partial [Kickxella alabastrina]